MTVSGDGAAALGRAFPSVLFDEAHSQAWSIRPDVAAAMNPRHPADASYAGAAELLRVRGMTVAALAGGALTPETLGDHDVLVIAHPSDGTWERVTGVGSPKLTGDEIDAVVAFVHSGGGVVVLTECEQNKYGNNVAELLDRFGVEPTHVTVQDVARNHNGVATWVLADLPRQHGTDDLLARVTSACFYRAGTLRATGPDATVLARTSRAADPAGEALAVTVPAGLGRVVVFSDSDLFGDDSLAEHSHAALWVNAVTWAGSASSHAAAPPMPSAAHDDPAWPALKDAVRDLRALQRADGSVDTDVFGEDGRTRAAEAVARCILAIASLRVHVAHDSDYLDAVVADLRRWRDGGFGVPDFLDSLLAFRPERQRVDGREHLVVFPMYTQNGNPARNLEAVLVRVAWPDWLADLESSRYDNAQFVPITFVDFTDGYDTNSAVLFPETVAVRETPVFTWGAIFCDREAARFRAVTSAAARVLHLSLPPAAARLVSHQVVAENTFALWDLIHDRTHSHGDLPFDPFMIKQRMPFWMYSLEELRCDLMAFREAAALESENATPYGELVQYAVLFDRLFRFPITGDRVRNYDGLGGQLLFAYLHRSGVLRWTDNTLTVDWLVVADAVGALGAEVDALYRDGIDRSRVGHWLAGHEFVSRYVAPHPRSVWAQGPAALPLDGPPKDLVDLVLPDEFPLNVFYEALRKKLATTIASTRGITGRSDGSSAVAG